MLKEFLGSGGLHSNSKQPTNIFKIGSSAKTMDDNSRLPVSPTPILRTKISPVGPTNNLTSTPSIQGTSDGVLADFFSNLLKKRPVVNNTTGETSSEPQLQRTSLSSDQKNKQQDNMDTSVNSSMYSINENGEKHFNIVVKEKHTENAKLERDFNEITKQNEYTRTDHENVENLSDATTNNQPIKIEKDEGKKKQQHEITKDMLSSLVPATNNSYVGLSDILINENNVAVLPDMATSGSDFTYTVLVDADYSKNTSSYGNSISSENFSNTITSPTNEGTASRASSVINSPLSIQKSLQSIKVSSRLKPSSYTNATIQKNSSLPPSPKLLQKPTVKQSVSGSQRSPTMTGSNFGQTNNLTNTKINYASSTSVNTSPHLIRKPLSSLSKNTDSKK
ncbi:unnamed protein product [Schistosoma spindalis]|nr:unnamed protein product [Schistosoma spindale]